MDADARVVEAIERLVVEAVGITAVALAAASPGVELSLPQWRALVVASSSPRGIRVGELAARLGSAVPTTSRLVRRLERRGLVDARRDEMDRRATLVQITSTGAQIRDALIERRRGLIRAALLGQPTPLAGDLHRGLEQIGEALGRYG